MAKKEIVKATPMELASDNIEVTPFGLKVNNEITRNEWTKAFNALQHVNTVYQWYLGDLIVTAEGKWKGDMYNDIIDATGMDFNSLANLASTARAYPLDVREYIFGEVNHMINGYTKIGFHHFRIAAPLMRTDPEHAVDFLVRAGKEGWTVETLREKISLWKNGGKLPEKRLTAPAVEPVGWEAVKSGGYSAFVDTPQEVSEATGRVEAKVMVGLYHSEIENLLDLIDGNKKFLSLASRLEDALRYARMLK